MSVLDEMCENIVLLRKAQGMTQEQVAFRSKLSISRLQDIEHGYSNTTVDTIIRIARTLRVDPQILGIFLRSDQEILSAIRNAPQLPKRPKGEFQICENIALLRKREGLTQKQLACISNVSVARLRDIEHGCANVTTNKLMAIAEAFDISLLELSALATSETELLNMIYRARMAAGVVFL
ncbi:MAG: transcriptional regulator [Lachnospiraceae bacterium]|nr:transcriptional regulator [Lachnospiraceae bacterium]